MMMIIRSFQKSVMVVVVVLLVLLSSYHPTTTAAAWTVDVVSGRPTTTLSKNVQQAIQQSGFGHPPDDDDDDGVSFPLPRNNILLDYSIFDGTSCVRDLPVTDLCLFDYTKELSKTAIAILLLVRGRTDAAHECILGVTPSNIDEAEYAATHRGQTSWSQNHPLSYEDDLVHALTHLWEGDLQGEGNATGWENAKYWIVGGPKHLYGYKKENDDGVNRRHSSNNKSAIHPIDVCLCELARSMAPQCVIAGVIASENPERQRTHEIIAGGRQYRSVTIPPGQWDPIAFVDLCSQRRELDKTMLEELDLLHDRMIKILLRYELLRSNTGTTNWEDLLTSKS